MVLWSVSRGAFKLLHGGLRSPVRARVRGCSGGPAHWVCYDLPHRKLLRLQGADTRTFLQGLITNDVTALRDRAALYSHLLNVQGRTLYDVILYSVGDPQESEDVLLECDGTLRDSVLRHLKVYKIRRNVSITACADLSVWALLPLQDGPHQDTQTPDLSSRDGVVVWEEDPRTPLMGRRLLLEKQVDPLDLVSSCRRGDTEDYHRHRYTIGLPEGVRDLPPGQALPLESNLVFLQGISFSKGCYIGQELTARTHHTGVVRKRLMPVRLSVPVQDLEEGAALQTQAGKAAGKLRAGLGELGLSLVRTAHAKETLTLKAPDGGHVTLEASVPDWWPKDQN